MSTGHDEIADVLRELAGLYLDVPGRARLADALASRPVDAGTLRDDPAALQELVDAVTLQETSFVRDKAVWAAIERDVLPAIDGPPVVWSAGCADGQEAWTLAMALSEAGRSDARILATDVSQQAVACARDGVYVERRMRGLDPLRRERHMQPCGSGRWEVGPHLRRLVTFEHHNLATEPIPQRAHGAHLTLCRNVLIYVDRPAVARFVDRLMTAAPEVTLVLGAAESLWHVSQRVRPVPLGAGFAYRAAQAADPPRRLPRPPAARPPRRAPKAPPVPVPPPPAAPTLAEVLEEGERRLTAGEPHAAVDAFRQAVYLAPDSVVAHMRLGLALEAAGDPGAGRAFRAALRALQAADPREVEPGLEGFIVDELARMLADKAAAR